MISANDKIEPGILKLQSVARPPLVAGTYTLNASVKLMKIDEGRDVVFNNNETTFSVSAPRYVFDPALVYSRYPLPNAIGAYNTTLPHIIFTSKTLPWERRIVATDPVTPWFSLLLLSDEEMEKNNVLISELPAGKITNNGGDPNLVVPALSEEAWEKKDVNATIMELPVSLFRSICADKTELPYLAHTRQVDMSDKENAVSNPKGWFSAMVCNRLPQRGQRNNVLLVSLEGHDSSLGAAAVPTKRLRLVVLNRWAFDEQGATFEEIVNRLTDKKNIGLLRIDPATMQGTGQDPRMKEYIDKALKYGYCPMSHNLRNGKNTVSWYRGPLVPADISTPEQYRYRSADEALRFDQETGMFDISYAAAWQLGRLLALQSPGFSTLINNWKEEYKRERPLNIAKKILKEEKEIGVNPDDLAGVVNEVESDELLNGFITEIWNRP